MPSYGAELADRLEQHAEPADWPKKADQLMDQSITLNQLIDKTNMRINWLTTIICCNQIDKNIVLNQLVDQYNGMSQLIDQNNALKQLIE